MATKVVKIYMSYARMDRLLVEDLIEHLRPLERLGLIQLWYDLEVAPGGSWNLALDKHLNEADLILLMVSPDFLASDYCYSKEMRYALERHAKGEARVIPILLRPVHWQDAPFSSLQVLPTDHQPVTRHADRDGAFKDIVESISKIIGASAAPKGHDDISLVDVGGRDKFPLSVSPHKDRISRRTVIIGGIATAVVIGGAGVLSIFRYGFPKGPQSSTPTPTVTLLPSDVLYEADWSRGMDGWSNPPGSIGTQIWTSHNGMLSCNGEIIADPSSLLITPPYRPPTRDYAVESEIQFLASPKDTSAYFGLIARDPESTFGAFGYFAGVSGDIALNAVILQAGPQASLPLELAHVSYQPDHKWHTYRLRLRGTVITFFVDNQVLFQVNDNTFLTSGLVGLVSSACVLNVRTFKVLMLG